MWTFLLAFVSVANLQQPAPAIDVRMQAWSRALGVECTHCHVEGDFASPAKPAFAFAMRMSSMVNGLNGGRLRPFGGITCWTCHRGMTRPARLPRDAWESIAKREAAAFSGPTQERALAMSVYSASLGVECTYCHDARDWTKAATPAHGVVRVMAGLFDEIPMYFTKERMPLLQCYLCHHGAPKPER